MKQMMVVLAAWVFLFFIPFAMAEDHRAAEAQDLENTLVLAQAGEGTDADFLEDEFEEESGNQVKVADPIYYFNQVMYTFNDRFYFYALKPLARGYGAVVPLVVRKGVRNVFYNLLFPVRFVNNLLQGKGRAALDEAGVFLVNSTAGILGLTRFAQDHMGMTTSDEDLGQTLGAHGIGNGFYLVLPFLGPSTLRDVLGRVGDYFITPLNYAEPWEVYWGATGLDAVNRTSLRIGDYEALKRASLDPYTAIRNAYIQNRQSLVEK